MTRRIITATTTTIISSLLLHLLIITTTAQEPPFNDLFTEEETNVFPLSTIKFFGGLAALDPWTIWPFRCQTPLPLGHPCERDDCNIELGRYVCRCDVCVYIHIPLSPHWSLYRAW